jgi:hypothetical protein
MSTGFSFMLWQSIVKRFRRASAIRRRQYDGACPAVTEKER